MAGYLRPNTVSEALEALRARRWTVLAGGTDFYPERVGKPLDDDVLDITALDALRGIEERRDHWRIPALTTWSDILAAELPPLFDGLKLAAKELGGVQIQNVATLSGNVCNASPAADGVPCLLSLGASVELSALDRVVALPVARFVLGNRQTALSPDQLMTAVIVPKPEAPRAYGHFRKLGARRYMVISIAMVAAVAEVAKDGTVRAARVAVGACSAMAQRLPDLEAALKGRRCAPGLGEAAVPAHLGPLAAIDDVRGSAAYRADAALTLVRRALDELGARP
jgi:CO/xanthine dehydrogenase FAD-binding subunit